MDSTLAAVTESIHRHWGWFLVLGICLVILGIIALIMQIHATIAGIFALGIIVAVAGILQIVGAFRAHGAGHIFLLLLVGVLDLIVGLILLSHPVAGALLVTLFLAAMFLVGGLFRIVSALALQYPHYGWATLSGVISCILGILLWAQWPISALWFIGFCIGVNFIFLGAAWIALASRLRAAGAAAA